MVQRRTFYTSCSRLADVQVVAVVKVTSHCCCSRLGMGKNRACPFMEMEQTCCPLSTSRTWPGKPRGVPLMLGVSWGPTSSVVVNVANTKPKTRYILAVDGSHSTQEEIVKAISNGLGTGKVHTEPKENALLNKELSVCNGKHLT